MLQVSGLISVTSNPELTIKELDTGSGAFFNFNVASEDTKGIIHIYRAGLFVPKADRKRWQKEIVPGNTFLVENAEWSMYPRTEEGKFPVPGLRLNHFKLRITANPMWFSKKES